MAASREERLRATLARLTQVHATEVSLIEESIALLQAELEALSQGKQHQEAVADIPSASDLLTIDRSQMCVIHRGRRCFLGNTLMLRFVEHLLRLPNRYVSYDDLLREVWHADRELSSVRSVVKEVRARLRAAGMSRVSDAIDGQVSGHYGLMLHRIK